METHDIILQGGTALITGALSFLAAFLRYKQRLADAEKALKVLAVEVPKYRQDAAETKSHYETLSQGWRLEFNQLKQDFEREIQHQRELAEAVKEDRASRPDPIETLGHDLHTLRQDIEKLRERGGRYVRSDVFASFTKSQEDQWKEMARTLGRMEGMLK